MKIVQKMGMCKFCGQQKYIQIAEDAADETINDQVSYECSCEAGKIWRAGIDDKKREDAMLIEAQGVAFALFDKDKPQIEELINELVPKMRAKEIKKLVIVHEKTKIAIRSTRDGVTITRSDVNTEEGKANK